jgi:putative CocE/NonD family hydrolase
MRDGARLFTAVYTPKDTSEQYPLLLNRTPYSVGPYGESRFPQYFGPPRGLVEEGYIFALQDVRGRFMSEGEFVNMRPHNTDKWALTDIDESTDTFDTIEWLLEHVPNHNGRVGMWGISYPGFYAAAGMIDAHPALVAVSPQAPIADWYFDDFHHHGAFFLMDAFNFFWHFGRPRDGLETDWRPRFDHGTPDGYQFFLDLGPLGNVNRRYFHNEIPFWNDLVAHPDYDHFWQTRNILPHLRDVAPAVMTVGGWFDAEDLYGPLEVYRAVEEQNPDVFNILVMGPWFHGGWERSDGDRVGAVEFGSDTSHFYREHIELPFFECFLKGKGTLRLPEAYVFETGANQWRMFDDWPPKGVQMRQLHVQSGGRLSFTPPDGPGDGYDEYVSDPARPVPYTETVTTDTPAGFLTDDQRFAACRPDVLAYQTEPLDEDVTLAGPIVADLWVSTSGTASDWIVKLIDVLPEDEHDYGELSSAMDVGGYQMMVRAEIFRGRYRRSYARPEPFVPNQPTRVAFKLQDVLHTFERGHRIMVQIQSSWFPLVDRNPQTYVPNVFLADEDDFIEATQRVFRSAQYPTSLWLPILPEGGG